jgi:hypothetical protein
LFDPANSDVAVEFEAPLEVAARRYPTVQHVHSADRPWQEVTTPVATVHPNIG